MGTMRVQQRAGQVGDFVEPAQAEQHEAATRWVREPAQGTNGHGAPAEGAAPRVAAYDRLGIVVLVGVVAAAGLAGAGLLAFLFGNPGVVTFEQALGFSLVALAVVALGVVALMVTLPKAMRALRGEMAAAQDTFQRAELDRDNRLAARMSEMRATLEAREAQLAQGLQRARADAQQAQERAAETESRREEAMRAEVQGTIERLSAEIQRLDAAFAGRGGEDAAFQERIERQLGQMQASAQERMSAAAGASKEEIAAQIRKELERFEAGIRERTKELGQQQDKTEKARAAFQRETEASLGDLERRIAAAAQQVEEGLRGFEEQLRSDREALEQKAADQRRKLDQDISARLAEAKGFTERATYELRSEVQRHVEGMQGRADELAEVAARLQREQAAFTADVAGKLAKAQKLNDDLASALNEVMKRNRFYTMLGAAVVVGLLVVVGAAAAGYAGPGVLNDRVAFAAAGLTLLVLAVGLLVLVFSLADTARTMRRHLQ